MPTALELAAANALEACASSTVGIIARVETRDTVIVPALRAKQVLYRFRKELGDPRYLDIQIRLSPDDPDNELWLIKTSTIPEAIRAPVTDAVIPTNDEDLVWAT